MKSSAVQKSKRIIIVNNFILETKFSGLSCQAPERIFCYIQSSGKSIEDFSDGNIIFSSMVNLHVSVALLLFLKSFKMS
jgi:hypothetical protein